MKKDPESMTKAFIDSDVLLDFLIEREPFALEAAQILTLAELKKIKLFTSAVVLANSYYILRKYNPHRLVTQRLMRLMEIIDVVCTDRKTVVSALTSGFIDFEDALQSYSATASDIQIIITRNISDYKQSTATVQLPTEFLIAYKQI